MDTPPAVTTTDRTDEASGSLEDSRATISDSIVLLQAPPAIAATPTNIAHLRRAFICSPFDREGIEKRNYTAACRLTSKKWPESETRGGLSLREYGVGSSFNLVVTCDRRRRRVVTRLVLASIIMAGVGCGGAPSLSHFENGHPVPLAMFANGDLFVDWIDGGDGAQVQVEPEGLWLQDAPHCGTFQSDVVATLNGHPMQLPTQVEVLTPPGAVGECLGPTLSVAIDSTWLDGSDGQIVVQDAATTWTITVPALMAGKSLVPQFPEGATVAAGDQLVFNWSSSMPLISEQEATLEAGGQSYEALAASASGATSVSVPSGLPAGPAQVEVHVDFTLGPYACPLQPCLSFGSIVRRDQITVR